MDRREELKARAREHERNNQPEHALEIYRGLLPDAGGSSLGTLMCRIGALQEKIGSRAAAIESFARAASAFSDAGQLNNAIAASQRLLRLDPEDMRGQLLLGELSLEQGLKDFARAGIFAYARHAASSDIPEDAVPKVAAFIGRYPDEADLCLAWEEDLAAAGDAGKAASVLDSLLDHLEVEGHSAAADLIARKRAPRRGNGSEARDGDGSAAPGPNLDLELEPHPGAGHSPDFAVAPLEGLESTAGGSYDFESFGGDDEDALPLLGNHPDLESDPGANVEMGRGDGGVSGVERFVSDGGEQSPERGSVDDLGGEDIPLLTPDIPLARGDSADSGGPPDSFDFAPVVEALREHAGVTVAPADAASHYDLGLAYKEMDRLDESLANLAMAMQEGHDPAAVMEVVGEILIRRGEYLLADDLLRRLPGVEEHVIPEHVGVYYWLARAAEKSGRRNEARRALQHVVSLDSNFRDAADRLRDLL